MLSLLEIVVFSIILILTVYGFFYPLYLRYRLIRLGQAENRFDRPLKRIWDAVSSFFFLRCSVKKERVFTGLVHIFILYGSLTFDTVSIHHIYEGFVPGAHLTPIHGLIADIFGVMVLVAVGYFIFRRYVLRPKSYTYPSMESVIIYALLITVTLTFFLYEAAAISRNPDHAELAFASTWLSQWVPGSALSVKIFWWIHILNVFLFVLYVPRSKYLHMIFGPINIAFQDYRPKGRIKALNLEDENAESFGVRTYSDMTWRDLFDGFACIDCGRCDDYCPAFSTDKPLSPKNIIWHMRNDLLKTGREKLKDPDKALPPLMESIYSDGEIWSCTTCGACMQVCPVKNEHIPKIVGVRQSQVLMEAKFPHELTQFFKNMDTNNNPWGFGSAGRGGWTEGKDLKIMAQDDSVEYLYWVGCAGAFDDRGKKVTDAFITVLQAAGVSFGVLGAEENCCGDQARRLGNEYLFQMMAMENIETLKRYKVKNLVVTCPHGYNTFKNEYPALAQQAGMEDYQIEVIHYTEMIHDLIRKGRLKLTKPFKDSLTYHDPCYIGRHNGIYNEPRRILSEAGGTIKEMGHNRDHSFCCGGGGGLMWSEENLGSRVNHMRTDQALETEAGVICTACPFCMTMLQDGVTDKGKNEERQVLDLAEIVARCL
jgi:Fe-S oxidoreductase